MPNTLTDQYQLVKTSTLDANFIQVLLGKTVNYNDGFCRELFRDGRHLKSLRSSSDSFTARKGDTMLSVNTGIITVPFTDKIPTRDGYHISYDATVRLAVADPRVFAVSYVQNVDPLQKTLDVIRAALLREVARGQHDAMTDVYLRSVVENDTGVRRPTQTPWGPMDTTLIVEYGVAILDAQTMIPHADPKRVAEIEEARRVALEKERLRKEEEIEKAKLAQQEVLERERLRVQDELARQQRVIDERKQEEAKKDDLEQWEHDRFKHEQGIRRDVALDIEIQGVRQREADDRAFYRELRGKGYSTANILSDYPELGYLLERRDVLTGQLLNGAELKQISSAATPQAAATSSTSNNSSGPDELFGVTREPRADDIFTISHLGVKVSRHTLTEQEVEWIQSPGQSFAYFVEAEVASGADDDDGDLQREDLIYQIDDKPVPELTELAPYLDTQQRKGNPVKVTYLRGRDSMVTLMEISSLRR